MQAKHSAGPNPGLRARHRLAATSLTLLHAASACAGSFIGFETVGPNLSSDATVLAPPPVMFHPGDADTEPSGNEPDSLPARSMPEWARPMAAPEVGWYESRPSPRAPRNAEWYAAAAGQALRVNTLDDLLDDKLP